MKPTVSVSIVTYNSKHIFETLDQWSSEILDSFPVKVIVYDNGSDEDYISNLDKYNSESIKIIHGSENKGFGHGHNSVLKIINSDFFIICNPDILVNKESFKKLYNFLSNSKSNVAMLTPKIVDPNGKTQYLVRRKLDVFDYMLRFIPFSFVKKIFKKRLDYYECRDLSDDIQSINYGSGAFMFTRTQAIKDIKGFDERFFMYFEDNDLCDRIRNNNGEIYYIPDAKISHFYGMESHRSLWGFNIFIKSMIKYFNKWGWRFF